MQNLQLHKVSQRLNKAYPLVATLAFVAVFMKSSLLSCNTFVGLAESDSQQTTSVAQWSKNSISFFLFLTDVTHLCQNGLHEEARSITNMPSPKLYCSLGIF